MTAQDRLEEQMVEDYLKDNFYQDPQVRAHLPDIEKSILDGTVLPTTAAENLLKFYFKKRNY